MTPDWDICSFKFSENKAFLIEIWSILAIFIPKIKNFIILDVPIWNHLKQREFTLSKQT